MFERLTCSIRLNHGFYHIQCNMFIDISSSNWNLLGAGLISFAIGAIGTIVYKRLKRAAQKPSKI